MEASGLILVTLGSPGRTGTQLWEDGRGNRPEGRSGTEDWVMGPRKPDLRQWEMLSITEQGNLGREGFRELSLVHVRKIGV